MLLKIQGPISLPSVTIKFIKIKLEYQFQIFQKKLRIYTFKKK